MPHVLLRCSYRLALGLEGPPQKVFRWAVQPIGDVFQIRKRDVYGPRFDVANIALAVPLSRQAVTILRELHPVTGSGRYLLPSVRTTARPMSDNTLNAALRRPGYTTDDMTAHGFRSMASTLLNEQGWGRDAIERQLAHGERDEVRAAYNYAEYLPERRKMMQAWSDFLDGLRANSGERALSSVGKSPAAVD